MFSPHLVSAWSCPTDAWRICLDELLLKWEKRNDTSADKCYCRMTFKLLAVLRINKTFLYFLLRSVHMCRIVWRSHKYSEYKKSNIYKSQSVLWQTWFCNSRVKLIIFKANNEISPFKQKTKQSKKVSPLNRQAKDPHSL